MLNLDFIVWSSRSLVDGAIPLVVFCFLIHTLRKSFSITRLYGYAFASSLVLFFFSFFLFSVCFQTLKRARPTPVRAVFLSRLQIGNDPIKSGYFYILIQLRRAKFFFSETIETVGTHSFRIASILQYFRVWSAIQFCPVLIHKVSCIISLWHLRRPTSMRIIAHDTHVFWIIIEYFSICKTWLELVCLSTRQQNRFLIWTTTAWDEKRTGLDEPKSPDEIHRTGCHRYDEDRLVRLVLPRCRCRQNPSPFYTVSM